MVTLRESPKLGDLIGRTVGGYKLERLLGEGGMGSVYLASNVRLGRQVAIKVISRKYTADPELVGRFFREAKAVAALDDANIIEIYDLHEFADGLTYISMKFIEGQSLAALLDAMRVIPLDAAVAIALQIASGLDAAHELGIVHRDIKPDNILVSRRWRRRYFVTIVDFGIAKLLDSHLTSNYQTQTAMVMGTLAYMAPEQARGERNIDARADIYSLGVVLYQMLTGRRPYDEETVYGLVEKHAQRAAFPRPRELRPDIPQVIDELLLEMLQIDRRRRPGSMKAVGQQLAKGVANGELMLRTLAARLSVGQVGPKNHSDDITLVGDVESSITRWTPARSTGRGRASGLRVALGVVAGVALGAGGMFAATGMPQPAGVRPDPSPHQVAASDGPTGPVTPSVHQTGPEAPATGGAKSIPAATTPEPVETKPVGAAAKIVDPAPAKPEPVETKPVGAAAKPVDPAPAKPEPLVTKPDAAAAKPEPGPTKPVASVAKPDASATKPDASATKPDASMAKPEASAAKPASGPLRSAQTSAKPPRADASGVAAAPARPDPTASRPASKPAVDATARQDSYLVIRIHTWADVSVNGKSVGTAPMRLKLPPGRYEVRLANESHDETIAVNIGGKAETVIEKSW